MKRKTSTNYPCPCGSGKKYNKCCMNKQKGLNDHYQKVQNNELPFTGYISTTDGKPASMKASRASIIRDGVETVLFEGDMTLSVNSVNGDSVPNSSAMFSVPPQGKPEIKIIGNASANSPTEQIIQLEIKNPKKELKVKSPNGLYAIIRLRKQIDADFLFLDILFGVKGQSETVDENGRKDRTHIAFYPDGTGKFIRISSHQCELESELGYQSSSKSIFPSKITIHSLDFNEKLVLLFDYSPLYNQAILADAMFV